MSEDRLEKLISELKDDLHSSMDKIEKKIDGVISELKDVNSRAIINSANITNIKEDVFSKAEEMTRQVNILHKRLRDCNASHEKCPAKIKEESVLEMKVWFYGTWVVGVLGLLVTAMKDVLFK